MIVEVLEGGPLTTVQQVGGRTGWRHLGVPVGGAADPWSARLANRLVGNADDAPLIESTLDGPILRFDAPAVVAICGGLRPFAGPVELRRSLTVRLPAGVELRLRPGDGARGYVAVAGGLEIAPVLGSAATDLRTGFGGLGGRALRHGDRLPVGTAGGPPRRLRSAPTASAGPIRILDGPHEAWFAPLDGTSWTVGTEADRTGVRLEGSLERGGGAEQVASMGLPLGAIQVPPDGRPIVMLVDRPVTGGYPVPAVVALADAGRAAQLRPGDPLALRRVGVEEARQALRRAEEELASLEPLEQASDDELGWTGSLE